MSGTLAGTNVQGVSLPAMRAYFALAALASVAAIVNSLSAIDEASASGIGASHARYWIGETTSLASSLALAPIIFWAAERLRPPHVAQATAVAGHLLLTIPFSAAHVALMVSFRHVVYGFQGIPYDYRIAPLYEWRKDAFFYCAAVVLFHLASRHWPFQRQGLPVPETVLVRHGGGARRVAVEQIEWVEAAGNYVELHGPFGTLLHRATLGGLARDWHRAGFLRVHRCRLVQVAKVNSIKRHRTHMEVELGSGSRVGVSRRYRGQLMAALNSRACAEV